jgi:hypothetical protein
VQRGTKSVHQTYLALCLTCLIVSPLRAARAYPCHCSFYHDGLLDSVRAYARLTSTTTLEVYTAYTRYCFCENGSCHAQRPLSSFNDESWTGVGQASIRESHWNASSSLALLCPLFHLPSPPPLSCPGCACPSARFGCGKLSLQGYQRASSVEMLDNPHLPFDLLSSVTDPLI